jgi:L-ascorbate metabolism protein UlaG (beta-lactamase superfamily)
MSVTALSFHYTIRLLRQQTVFDGGLALCYNGIAIRKGGQCMDIALLPVSGTYVMTAQETVVAARDIQPRVVVQMHYSGGGSVPKLTRSDFRTSGRAKPPSRRNQPRHRF